MSGEAHLALSLIVINVAVLVLGAGAREDNAAKAVVGYVLCLAALVLALGAGALGVQAHP